MKKHAQSLAVVLLAAALLLVPGLAVLPPVPAKAASAAAPRAPDFFWQNPLPQGNALQDVSAADARTAWAVGDTGTILMTADAGASWRAQDVSTTSSLHGVSAIDAHTAWVCGEDNVVLRTTDGGRNWASVLPDIQGDFYSVSALNGQVAWIAGNNQGIALIQKTTDGGQTWADQSPLDYGINDISAVDAGVVWAVTWRGTFYSSTDGGDSWNQADSPVGSIHNRVQAFSATRAYAVTDYGYFVKTTDGVNFTATEVTPGRNLKSLTFSSPQTGWVVGDDGYIGVTNDGGAGWAVQASGITDVLLGIGRCETGQLFACGSSGQLLRAELPAGPWTRLGSGDTDDLHGMTSAGDRTAWACGLDGTILHTADGGASWVPQNSGVSTLINVIDASSTEVAWACGDEGALVRTNDGGGSWHRVDPGPLKGVNAYSVSCLGWDSAWVSGGNGIVMKTSDGGASWERFDQGSRGTLIVNAVDARTAYCVRQADDIITQTVDGGATWIRRRLVFTGHSVSLNNLCVVDEKTAYATAWVVETGMLGDFGMVFKTGDGGATWRATMKTHAPLLLLDVSSRDGINVWATGLFGLTYRSTDGGATWLEQEFIQNDAFFYAAEAVDGQAAWLAGAGGYIVRTTAPQLYSVSPSNGANTGVVDIGDVAGSGFQPGMRLELVRGDRRIEATQVDVGSPYRASCRFDLSGASEGEWDVVATNNNGLSEKLAGGFHVSSRKTWYLAEGSTGLGHLGSFETWVLIQNPGDSPASAKLTYLTPGGKREGPDVVLPPGSRSTVNVADTLPDCWEVSTVVESDVPVVVERAMYWDTPSAYRESAGGSIGTPFASSSWYLAEGSTGFDERGRFDTYITVANPQDAESEVTVTFMTPEGAVAGPTASVGPGTRWTVNAADWVPGRWSVATRVAATVPVVAERSVYWNEAGRARVAAHNSIGAAHPSRRWFLPEGSTGAATNGGFETWIVVQNPGDHRATAALSYQTPSGTVPGPTLSLGPGSRQSVNVADTVPNEYSVSTGIFSNNPVVAERSTYFNTMTTYRQLGQSSLGADAPAVEWNLAEGSTGGDAAGAFETWVLVQNPGDAEARVVLTYMTPEGEKAGPVVMVGAGSRVSVNVAETVAGNWNVSTKVTSSVPVVAEAAVYWNAAGTPKQCAHSSIGYPF